MATTSNKVLLGDFFNIIIPKFIVELDNIKKQIEIEWKRITKDKKYDLDNPKNIYQLEVNYHVKTRTNEDVLSKFPLHHMLSKDYKLLMDRTLMLSYESVFNKLLETQNPKETHIVSEVMKQIQLHQLGQVITQLILAHPTICAYMDNLATELEQQAEKSIVYLDTQPVIEQKTEPWFAARMDTISASGCGYIDAKACGCDMSKETNEIKEKCNLIPKKQFGWYQMPLRRGQQYEDLSRAFYESIHQITAKEYGLLIDKTYKHIAASPDGVVISVDHPSCHSAQHKILPNYLRRRLLGRMIEIKNPYSAQITSSTEPYYYWQTLQQMKVCDLPFCDFVKTRFRIRGNYQENKPSTRLNWKLLTDDQFDLLDMQQNCREWSQLPEYLSQVVYQNLRWHVLIDYLALDTPLETIPITKLSNLLTTTFTRNFNDISPCVWQNLTCKTPSGTFEARGRNAAIPNTNAAMPKGILWCWNKFDGDGNALSEFRVEFTTPDVPITREYVNKLFDEKNAQHCADDYELFECYVWNLCQYQEIEVEYNQGIYEGWSDTPSGTNSILTRLHQKWNIIKTLRSIPNDRDKWREYAKLYPKDTAIPTDIYSESESETELNTESGEVWEFD